MDKLYTQIQAKCWQQISLDSDSLNMEAYTQTKMAEPPNIVIPPGLSFLSSLSPFNASFLAFFLCACQGLNGSRKQNDMTMTSSDIQMISCLSLWQSDAFPKCCCVKNSSKVSMVQQHILSFCDMWHHAQPLNLHTHLRGCLCF